jgi:hypothetical protein
MFTALLGTLLESMCHALPKKVAQEAADAFLDRVEDAVARSTTRIDDATVLPICNMIRRCFDIPDDDDPCLQIGEPPGDLAVDPENPNEETPGA